MSFLIYIYNIYICTYGDIQLDAQKKNACGMY